MLTADINGCLHGVDDTPLEKVICFMDDGIVTDIFIAKELSNEVIDFATETSKSEIALNRAFVDKVTNAVNNGTHLHVYGS